jgi:hypothetical protein
VVSPKKCSTATLTLNFAAFKMRVASAWLETRSRSRKWRKEGDERMDERSERKREGRMYVAWVSCWSCSIAFF